MSPNIQTEGKRIAVCGKCTADFLNDGKWLVMMGNHGKKRSLQPIHGEALLHFHSCTARKVNKKLCDPTKHNLEHTHTHIILPG